MIYKKGQASRTGQPIMNLSGVLRAFFMSLIIVSVSSSAWAIDQCEEKELLVTASPEAAQGGTFDFEVLEGECWFPNETSVTSGTFTTEQTFYCCHGAVVNISNAQYIADSYFFNRYTVDGDESPVITEDYATVTLNCFDDEPNVVITLNYLYDDECPDVEVINPAANDPIIWYYGSILIKGVATESWPGSGVKNVTTQVSDQFGLWFAPDYPPYRYEMTYNPVSGFYERYWPSPNYTLCAFSNVRIWAEDWTGNECSDTNKFGIDNAPPVTTKEWGEPYVVCEEEDPFNCHLFVTSATEFSLSAEEIDEYGNPCGIGVDKIYYQIDGGTIHTYTGPFTLPEGCGRNLTYWAVDLIGNTEHHHIQIDNVDDTPPKTTKSFDGPTYDRVTGDNYYVTVGTTVILDAEDFPEDCPVGVDYLWYEIWWDSDGDGIAYEDTLLESGMDKDGHVEYSFDRESVHEIRWYAVDKLGNKEQLHVQEHAVDNTPPVIKKTVVGEHFGDCPPEPDSEEWCQIDGNTAIHVEALDPEPHPVDNVECEWRYELLDTEGGGGGEATPPFDINFPEESVHALFIRCWDALGNEVYDGPEIFIVDKTPPVTEKWYEGEQFPSRGYPKWIKTNTSVVLEASDDAGPHESGIRVTYWRNSLVDERYCWDQELCQEAEGYGDWNVYEGPFTKDEESCHLIEYYSVDGVGKVEDVKKQCVFVDDTPPEVEKELGDPKVPAGEVQYEPSGEYEVYDGAWYITQQTPIYLNCQDPEPHPVDHETIYYMYFVNGEPAMEGWEEYPGPFSYGEDSYHELYYYCVDALGNTGRVHYELDIVDSQPPETEKDVIGENVIPGPEEGVDYLIDDKAQIVLTCEDPEPHPVDDVTVYWSTRWSRDGEEWTEWSEPAIYEEPISFDESSYHQVEYWCVDALGNEEKHHFETDAVDLDPPETDKEVCEPQYIGEDEYDYWITQDTPISLDCEDVYPHPSGAYKIYYRYDVDGEGYTSWMEYDGPIRFGEDSVHTLQYYCMDRFGNKEEIHTEVDNVDTAPPEIEKYVRVNGGEPIYEGDVYVGGDDRVKFCARVRDVKQTDDPGVGVWTVHGRTSELDDPEMPWDEEEQAYCFEREAQYEECGRWHFEVTATDYLGNEAEWTDGLEILIDNTSPIGEVLNPHAGQYYRDGKPFYVYMPVIDFGGNTCESDCILDQVGCMFDNHDCPASGVDQCTFYAVDYNFEGINQSNVKDLWDYLEELYKMGINPKVVELGTLDAVVEGNEVICKGELTIPEDSGLNDTVFLWVDIVDNVGNKYSWLALNPWLSPITMNMDNEGPGVFITDIGTLEGPLTEGDTVSLQAEVDEYQSGFDDCWADIYTDNEGEPGGDTGYDIPGTALDYNLCEINGPLPEGLESGNYYLMVHARDEQFNIGTASTTMMVDNDRPSMEVASPQTGGVYNEMLPVSLYLDDRTGIAPETVKFRVMEIPAVGNLFCLFGMCEDTGWVALNSEEGNWYEETINVTEYGISGEGRYVFDAVGCDPLYRPEPDTELGFDMGNSRTAMHCRMISQHGAEMYGED